MAYSSGGIGGWLERHESDKAGVIYEVLAAAEGG